MGRIIRSSALWAVAAIAAIGPSACGGAAGPSGGGGAGGDEVGGSGGQTNSGGKGGAGGSSGKGGQGGSSSNGGTGGSVDEGGAGGSASGGAGGSSEGGAGGGSGGAGGKAGRPDGGTTTGGQVGSDGGPGAGGAGGATMEGAGLKVSGTDIVDGTGKKFIPRGLGVGEIFNIESYFLDFETPDIGGVGQTKFEQMLVAAMGKETTDKFFATWRANLVTPEDVAKWASWGVNSIRLPINHHSLSPAMGMYLEEGFKAIDDFVAMCKAQNIYVILDLHAAPGAQNNEQMADSLDGKAHLWSEPDKYQPWTIDLWKTIAKRYANEPFVGGYNIFDEPLEVSASALRAFYVKVTTAIRSVDPKHILYIDGLNWSADPGFKGLEPAWDPQLVWSFHKYWDTNNLASIQPYISLRSSTMRPVWNGETGESMSGQSWNTEMIKLCEGQNIGWNMWTYKKIGGDTQPYAIKAPANWSKMTAYFKGGAMPSMADATKIMMELADNAATSKCTYNAAYVKAVFNK